MHWQWYNCSILINHARRRKVVLFFEHHKAKCCALAHLPWQPQRVLFIDHLLHGEVGREKCFLLQVRPPSQSIEKWATDGFLPSLLVGTTPISLASRVLNMHPLKLHNVESFKDATAEPFLVERYGNSIAFRSEFSGNYLVQPKFFTFPGTTVAAVPPVPQFVTRSSIGSATLNDALFTLNPTADGFMV